MHAAAQWTSLMWFYGGQTVVLMEGPLDPEAVWAVVETEGVNLLTVVGDAVAKPLLDAWDANPGPLGRVDRVLDLQRRGADVGGLQGPHPRPLPQRDGQRRLRLVGGGDPGVVAGHRRRPAARRVAP